MLLLFLRVCHTLCWLAILRRSEEQLASRKVELASKKEISNSNNSSGRSVSPGGMVVVAKKEKGSRKTEVARFLSAAAYSVCYHPAAHFTTVCRTNCSNVVV